MKLKKYIFQGLSLLMLACVFTTQVSAVMVQPEVQTLVQDDDEENSDDTLVYSQLVQESVVPHYSFSFGDVQVFLDKFSTGLQFLKFNIKPFGKFLLTHDSYFDKIFELHIAINAP